MVLLITNGRAIFRTRMLEAVPIHGMERESEDRVLRFQDRLDQQQWRIQMVSMLAFHHHLAETPEEADTSAFLATPWVQTTGHSSSPSTGQREPSSLHRLICRQFESPRSVNHSQPKPPSAAERDLVALLPPTEAAVLLIDNYFDRVHWFVLLFHQREFRNKFFYLYAPDPNDPQRSNTGPRSRVGDIAVLLAVMATSLKYTNDSQKDILTVNGVDAELLGNKILTALRLRLLDILSVGTIEVVQTLVLLGSYYLFHGEPELAWPLCGCALRIAQALNLHRRPSPRDPTGSVLKPSNAARKRCWWAVYEIETFCSMLYGFPLSISDTDCDVEPLDIYDESSASVIQENDPLQPTLLHYKCAMSTLSALVKSALVDLYGTRRNRNPQDNSILDKMSRLPILMKKVEALSTRLNNWHTKLPEKLRLGNLDASSAARQHPKNILGGETHSPIPFEEQVFQLQAFALKLAFENAKILIHRPLLSFKIITRSRSPRSASNRRVDPCASAIDTCRDSALQISLIGLCPIVRHAADTYAAVFMSLHLFTAAVTICIITSLDPLNPKSHECKLGIRRLMEMQTLLKDKSIVASQGLEITKQLMSLALTKEIDAIFGVSSFSPNSSSAKAPLNNAAQVSIPENNVTAQAEFSPVANPLIVSPQTEMSLQPSGTQEGISTEVDHFIFDPASFEFGENPCMTEALLDFGQETWITNKRTGWIYQRRLKRIALLVKIKDGSGGGECEG
ncbi:hypothetical protein N7453_003749 [Penicillium expansum]|nr:hypothetical protein N7453_003749 [Penicillium expansum]